MFFETLISICFKVGVAALADWQVSEGRGRLKAVQTKHIKAIKVLQFFFAFLKDTMEVFLHCVNTKMKPSEQVWNLEAQTWTTPDCEKKNPPSTIPLSSL